jgi:glycosyltransferase involved in cell wall biosynthesis
MIRVLLVMTARQVGGAELYVANLVEALSGKACFTVAASDDPELQRLRARLSTHSEVVPLSFDSGPALPGVLRRLRWLAGQHEVVHLNSNHPASRLGIAVGLALGGRTPPLVAVEHRATEIGDVKTPAVLAPMLPAMFRRSRRGVAVTVAVSRENLQTLTGIYGLPPQRVRLIYYGVPLTATDAAQPARRQIEAELGLPPTASLVLTPARLAANKGHRYLLEAAPAILAAHPSAHFLFAGAPDDPTPIEESIRALGLGGKVTLLGAREDMSRLLGAADVVVLPSLAEGLALAVLEGLAAGLPVVATRAGGAAEAIEDGVSGFLVPPADAPSLGRAVVAALSMDPAARLALGRSARGRATYFSVDRMADEMLALYEEVGATRR